MIRHDGTPMAYPIRTMGLKEKLSVIIGADALSFVIEDLVRIEQDSRRLQTATDLPSLCSELRSAVKMVMTGAAGPSMSCKILAYMGTVSFKPIGSFSAAAEEITHGLIEVRYDNSGIVVDFPRQFLDDFQETLTYMKGEVAYSGELEWLDITPLHRFLMAIPEACASREKTFMIPARLPMVLEERYYGKQ